MKQNKAMLFIRALLLLCLSLACLKSAWAGKLSVAVASNFSSPAKQIATRFEAQTGHKLIMSFGSTGQFHAQIKNGAPFEVFLSADSLTAALLEESGLAVAASRFTYATGKLVLWSPLPGFVDDQGAVLRKNAFQKIAMANPKLAPYGAAALETLEKMGLKEGLKDRIVEGLNITQTHQFVASGNVPLGFVALSQVFENGNLAAGSAWIVPKGMHAPIRQDAVLLKKGMSNPAAQAFLQFLRSEEAKAVIRAYGYELE